MEKKKTTTGVLVLRIVFTLLCVATLIWIFSNSLRTAEESSEQSAGVVEIVQEVARVIAPDSAIANATGEDYDALHSVIRTVAHFLEFAWLGFLLICCWRSYTDKKIWAVLPAALVVIVPVLDEVLQSFTGGRAAEWKDIAVDIAGGVVGGGVAILAAWLLLSILRKREKRRAENGERELGNRVDEVQ